MLHTIDVFEFIEHEDEFALVTGRLAEYPSADPAFLVSVVDNNCYLRRSREELFELSNIDPSVMERLRRQEFVIVVEMEGMRPAYSYDAPAGPLEYDGDAWAITKTLTVAWHRVARYWNGKGGAP